MLAPQQCHWAMTAFWGTDTHTTAALHGELPASVGFSVSAEEEEITCRKNVMTEK